jgi:putative hydrolase of the HAD superfamily
MPRTLRAVSFDAAGTLFHPARPVGELYATIAARHGIRVDVADLHARFSAAFASAPPLAFPGAAAGGLRAREKAWWHDLVRRVFDGIPVADFEGYFEDLFAFFASAAAWRIDPDAPALLAALRARGLAILLVSNFDARVRGVIAALGLAPLIDHVTLSSEAGAAKPDPAIFRTALAAAGLEPAAVVHVGDTVREDLAAARAAGLDVVLVGGRDLAAAAPDATVLPRLADVAAWLSDRLAAPPGRPAARD